MHGCKSSAADSIRAICSFYIYTATHTNRSRGDNAMIITRRLRGTDETDVRHHWRRMPRRQYITILIKYITAL